jgi:hypothetical protein
MVILITQYPEHFGLCIVIFRPVAKEYRKAVHQPQERAKIQAVISSMGHLGFQDPGLRVEKVKGDAGDLLELKITAGGCEHRFLGAYKGTRAPDGRPIFVLLKYLKKKEWSLDRSAIETARQRLAQIKRSGT